MRLRSILIIKTIILRVFLCSIFALVLFGCRTNQTLSKEKPKVKSSIGTLIKNDAESPCLRPDPLNVNWSERERGDWQKEYSRRINGYSSDVSLSWAINQFNKDAKCQETIGSSQPPLSIQELLTAVRDVSEDDKNFPSLTLKLFKRISDEQVMPKGSLLWYEWGYNQAGKYDATFWKIYVYVDLDKYPLDEAGHSGVAPHKQLLRLQYISSVPLVR